MDGRPTPAGSLWAIVLAGAEGVRLRPLVREVFGGERPKQYVRGAARGAAVGATAGAIAGDAGKGAAAGAAAGTVAGGMQKRQARREQAAAADQQQAAAAQGQGAYDKAVTACMQGRGYMLK